VRSRVAAIAIIAIVVSCGRRESGAPIVADEIVRDASIDATDAKDAPDAGVVVVVVEEDARPRGTGDCLTEIERATPLDDAWLDGTRVDFCVRDATTKARTCFGVDPKTGEYRRLVALAKHAKTKPTFDTLPVVSGDGKRALLFRGGLRTPPGATATLVDAATHAPMNSASILYDEHLAFDGWIGSAAIFHTWVDEGPGCVRKIVDLSTTWPPDPMSAPTITGCYGTEDWIWNLSRHRVLFVDGDGSGVAFVDATTLGVHVVETGITPSDFDLADNLAAINVRGETSAFGMIVVYGSASSGDLAEIDLDRETLVRTWTPLICKS
jgi:hypothetical protein